MSSLLGDSKINFWGLNATKSASNNKDKEQLTIAYSTTEKLLPASNLPNVAAVGGFPGEEQLHLRTSRGYRAPAPVKRPTELGLFVATSCCG